MTAPVEIRRRSTGDLPLLAEMLTRVQRETGYPEIVPEDPTGWLASPRLFVSFVAIVNGELAGQVSLATASGDNALSHWERALGVQADDLVVLKRLFVEPALSRRGIGRRLLEHAVAEAHRRRLWPVLDVDVRSVRAIRLYERAGFRPVGTAELHFPGRAAPFLALCLVGPAPAALAAAGEG